MTTKDTNLTTQDTQALTTLDDMFVAERPAGKDEGLLGNEGIGRDDILMPRLGLAQKMSPEIDPTSPRHIEGLQFTDLFHSTLKKPLGKGPLKFVILRRYEPRWIEFIPIDKGGGVKDMNIYAGDPRTKFTNGVQPIATMFYDFIVLLLTPDFSFDEPMNNVIALSFKSSGLKAAKHLNFLVQQRGNKLICKGVYELTTGSATDKKSGGVYATYNIRNANWLKPDSQLEKLVIGMYESWKEREAKIDTDMTGDPDDSMAANPEDPQM